MGERRSPLVLGENPGGPRVAGPVPGTELHDASSPYFFATLYATRRPSLGRGPTMGAAYFRKAAVTSLPDASVAE